MRNKQMYLDKIDGLVKLADDIIKVVRTPHILYDPMDATDRKRLLSESEQFITDLYGTESPMHRNFPLASSHTNLNAATRYAEVKDVLLAIKNNIEQGWLDSVKNELSAEIFGDYLEMASYLNGEGYYIAAAVIAGTTLEERLRQLCLDNGLPIEKQDAAGKTEPIKADSLNTSLAGFYADGKQDVKLVAANYGLRNQAAHGEWNNDLPEKKGIRVDHVSSMIDQIRHFIKTNPI